MTLEQELMEKLRTYPHNTIEREELYKIIAMAEDMYHYNGTEYNEGWQDAVTYIWNMLKY